MMVEASNACLDAKIIVDDMIQCFQLLHGINLQVKETIVEA